MGDHPPTLIPSASVRLSWESLRGMERAFWSRKVDVERGSVGASRR
jgi:hypothetical protein